MSDIIMTHYGKQCGSASSVNSSSCVNIIVDPVFLLLVHSENVLSTFSTQQYIVYRCITGTFIIYLHTFGIKYFLSAAVPCKLNTHFCSSF